MKTKIRLTLLISGFALSMGVISASIFSPELKVLETSAADLSVFGKEVCEITIGSSGYTASPNILEDNKIVNSSYVYSIKMASGVTSSPYFPTINYSSEYEGSPIYDIVLNNVSIQSVDWASSCSIENKHLDKQLVVNWYCEGSNYIKSHNWNAIVMRNNGNGRIVFSTLTGGNFIAQDSYNNCSPFDDRGYIELAIDSKVSVSSAKNTSSTYSSNISDADLCSFLRSGMTFGNKIFNLSMTRQSNFASPVVEIFFYYLIVFTK